MGVDFSLNGRFTEQMLRGYLFCYKCPAQALLLTATAGGHPTLWNPAGSGKVFVPVRLVFGFVSGTTVIGSVLIAETVLAGNGIGATAPIVTFTDVAGVPARRGAGYGSTMRWAPTVNTFTAAPTVVSATSINLGAADPTNSGHDHQMMFDGILGFEPGSAMSLVYSVTSSVALFHVTLFGLELPYPNL
jgi:hypothetical protein